MWWAHTAWDYDDRWRVNHGPLWQALCNKIRIDIFKGEAARDLRNIDEGFYLHPLCGSNGRNNLHHKKGPATGICHCLPVLELRTGVELPGAEDLETGLHVGKRQLDDHLYFGDVWYKTKEGSAASHQVHRVQVLRHPFNVPSLLWM